MNSPNYSNYEIGQLVLRYVVPFTYDGTFDHAFGKVESQENKWIRLYAEHAHASESESDLYDYVRNEAAFEKGKDPEEDSIPESRIGASWLHRKDGKGGVLHLRYFPDGIEPDDMELPSFWKIRMSDLGLVLYRNSLGLIWFELIPEFGKHCSSNDSIHLVQFQNRIRELNRENEAYLWLECQGDLPECGIEVGGLENHRQYITPFSTGEWISQLGASIIGSRDDMHFFAERTSAFHQMQAYAMKKAVHMQRIQKKPGNTEYDGRKTMEQPGLVPDKALLFTYACFETASSDGGEKPDFLPAGEAPFDTGKEDIQDPDHYVLSYYLTNGYKESYGFSNDIIQEMKHPFSNVIWNATQEGVSYLAWITNPGERKAFLGTIPAKIRTDYFKLYLNTLYQSYSLLIYAEQIQEEIPAEINHFFQEPYYQTEPSDEKQQALNENEIEKLTERITKLHRSINLFLTKSMATSVSHIHHQSEFYIYVKKKLRIREDVQSVMAGLESLSSLLMEQNKEQREAHERATEEKERRRDNRTQSILGLLAVLGIFSALVDCFDFLRKFQSGGEWAEITKKHPVILGLELVFLLIILVIGIITAVVTLKSIRFTREEKEEKGGHNISG